MPIRNVLLVKYQGGYVEVALPQLSARRREGSISIDVGTRGEAVQVATTLVTLLRNASEEIVATIEPTGAGDEPYADFLIGDLVHIPDRHGVSVEARVVGMTVTIDAEGNPVFVPEFDLGHDVEA